jgi:aconitate hydratase
MSPPLVVAFALAGTVNIDLSSEPLGKGKNGQAVYLRDVWPTLQEIRHQMEAALKPEVFRELYSDLSDQNPKWNEIPTSLGKIYAWDPASTYIREPPFFKDFTREPRELRAIAGARALAIFGDS